MAYVIVNLMGGMGNQMFQYAFGRKLSIDYNIPLKLDLRFLKKRNRPKDFVYRDYDLDLFTIQEDTRLPLLMFPKKINEPYFHYSTEAVSEANEFLTKGQSIYLNGYWQSPKYFSGIENTLKKDFEFKQALSEKAQALLQKIQSENSVLINIRRTDFLKPSIHSVVGLDFVEKATTIIKNRVTNPHYFVFSDDIEWCKEHIQLDNITIVDHSYKGDRFSDYLQLMIACKHFIIPNSTFAWWAAWLSPNTNKIIINPEEWFTEKRFETKDLVPAEWIRV